MNKARYIKKSTAFLKKDSAFFMVLIWNYFKESKASLKGAGLEPKVAPFQGPIPQ